MDSALLFIVFGVGIIGCIAFYFAVRREFRKLDWRAQFEAYKWGAENPDFMAETREECRAALKTMAEVDAGIIFKERR